ncbi:MAG: hypothetical protein ACTSYY_09900, partial [Promethearchaeota archaeon]
KKKEDEKMIYEGNEELYCHIDTYPGILDVFLQNKTENSIQVSLYPHFQHFVKIHTEIPTIKLMAHQFTNFQFIYSSNKPTKGSILSIFHENEKELLLCMNEVEIAKVQKRDLFYYKTFKKIFPLIEGRHIMIDRNIIPIQINEILSNTRYIFHSINHEYRDNILTWISFNPFILVNLKNGFLEIYSSNTKILDEIESIIHDFKGGGQKQIKNYKNFFELGICLSTISDYISIRWDIEPTLEKLYEISGLLKKLHIDYSVDVLFNNLKSKKSINEVSNTEINELNRAINQLYTKIRMGLGEIA